jgi:hypothetical protein
MLTSSDPRIEIFEKSLPGIYLPGIRVDQNKGLLADAHGRSEGPVLLTSFKRLVKGFIKTDIVGLKEGELRGNHPIPRSFHKGTFWKLHFMISSRRVRTLFLDDSYKRIRFLYRPWRAQKRGQLILVRDGIVFSLPARTDY